jgi:hypothetical protein
MDTSTSTYTHVMSLYIHTTATIYPESDVGCGDTTIPRLGAPQSSVFDRLTPPIQDRLRAPQSGPQAQAQQDCRTTRPQRLTNPAGGHIATASNSTIKKDVIKIGMIDVVVQQNNEGLMIFGESANTNKKEYTTVNKTTDPKYSMPRWCPSGLTRSQKQKLHRLRAKENREKEAEKYSMTHIRSTHHRKRDGDQRPLRKSKQPQRQKIKQLCNSLYMYGRQSGYKGRTIRTTP